MVRKKIIGQKWFWVKNNLVQKIWVNIILSPKKFWIKKNWDQKIMFLVPQKIKWFHGLMSRWKLALTKDGPRNLLLKFGQHLDSKKLDILDMEEGSTRSQEPTLKHSRSMGVPDSLFYLVWNTQKSKGFHTSLFRRTSLRAFMTSSNKAVMIFQTQYVKTHLVKTLFLLVPTI